MYLVSTILQSIFVRLHLSVVFSIEVCDGIIKVSPPSQSSPMFVKRRLPLLPLLALERSRSKLNQSIKNIKARLTFSQAATRTHCGWTMLLKTQTKKWLVYVLNGQ